jgi:hypothetical protein
MEAPGGDARRARLNRLAWLLDSSIRVPGTDFRIGLDALLGLLPGGGDAAGVILSSYIVLEAARMGVPRRTLWLMIGNIAVEGLAGAVPVAGDLFDAAWKANQRNVDLLNAYFDQPGRVKAATRAYLFLLLAMMALLVLATSVIAYFMVNWVWSAFATPIVAA